MRSIFFLCSFTSAIWFVVCLIGIGDAPDDIRRKWARWTLLTPLASILLIPLILYHIGRGVNKLWRMADISMPKFKMKPPKEMKKVKIVKKYQCAKCGSPMTEGPYK